MVPLSAYTVILYLSIDNFHALLYLILCLAFHGHVYIVFYLQGVSIFLAPPPIQNNLVGYETRPNGVKDPVMPRHKVCTAGNFESDFV